MPRNRPFKQRFAGCDDVEIGDYIEDRNQAHFYIRDIGSGVIDATGVYFDRLHRIDTALAAAIIETLLKGSNS